MKIKKCIIIIDVICKWVIIFLLIMNTTNKNNVDLIIAYNVNFDMRYIWNILHIVPNTECCMLHFAILYGEYSYYWDDYKWQTLYTAMDYFNLKWKGHQHCSLSDTFACKDVWLSMYPDFFNDFM